MSRSRTSQVLIFAAMLALTSANAYEYEERSLEELFDQAVVVAVAEIVSSDVLTADLDTDCIDCGNVYTANVVRAYKGDVGKVRFASFARLPIRSTHLVFLVQEYRDAVVNYTSMGVNREDKLNACLLLGIDYYASMLHGEIYQIDYLHGQAHSVKVATLNRPFDGLVTAERIDLESPLLSDEELDAASYWRVMWLSLEARILDLMQDASGKND